ncbi:hypothetical protein IL306_001301 [Fusarium sp. DS 682]|nr:hypothetical protein IL306_001301 [Fusarium sp. DS 682]
MDHQVLAAAGEQFKFVSTALEFKSIINISHVVGQDNVVKTGDTTVAMESFSAAVLEDGRTVTFPFSILAECTPTTNGKGKQAGYNGDFRMQTFEWRQTSRDEIFDKNYAHEYKLFRRQFPSAFWGSMASDKAVAATSF